MNIRLMLTGFAAAAALSSIAFAQEPAQEPARGGPRNMPPRGERAARSFPMGGGAQGESIFFRMLERPEFIEKIGLPEDKVKVIQEGFKKVAEAEAGLFRQRAELLKKNSEIMADFMSDRSKTPEVLEKAFAELEELQLKISKLSVERMVIIRDNLDADQIKKARESVKAKFEERRRERIGERQRHFGEGREGGKRGAMPEAAKEPVKE